MPIKLFATVADPDGDSLTVTFYGRPVTAAARPDFTLIELPDTQNYCASLVGAYPADFLAQTNWIVSNRVNRNIAAVLHVGDIVQSGDEVPAEWTVAEFCMRRLEDPAATLRPDGIPYGVAPGNHDIGRLNQAMTYNQYFGVSRFQGRGYYGGHYGNDNSNWFVRFRASGLDFIVIGIKLAWEGDAAVVAWADSLLAAYPNHRAIIVSHYLLDPGPPATFSPQGQMIYNGLKHRTNLIMMVCGHFVDEARRADTWNGHTIHTIMANYQNRGGGDGWLRIMEFSPAHNHIRMRTYSTKLGHFEVDPDSSSQFTIPCDLSGAPGGFEPVGTYARVPPGQTVSIVWAGLRRGGTYEWFASVSDRSATVNGPVQRFDIVDGAPPVARITTPNGGEALVAGEPVDVRWTATDNYEVRSVDLFLSRSGRPWETLALNLENTGSYQWIAKGPSTEGAVIALMARDMSYNWTVDASDSPFRIVGTTGVGDGPAGGLALEPVAPNPTRGPSRIGVVLPAAERIRLTILDMAGREVAVLADGTAEAGRSEFSWDGRIGRDRAPAGLYFVRLHHAGRDLTRRFAITR